MNSRKKIINTLKKADRASVEKLMAEETKKNEIFARAVRKANIEKNEYTDVVNGVEKYERRISMTRIASIAAAAVLMAGSIGGGAYLFKNSNKTDPDGDSNFNSATTENTNVTDPSETTIVTTGNVTAKVSSSTSTSANTAVVTVVSTSVANNNPAVTSEANSSDNNAQASNWSISKEELLNRMMNSRNNYDKFSSDFTLEDDSIVEWDPYGSYMTGSVYFDRASGRSYCLSDNFFLANGEKERTEIAYASGGYRIAATEYCANAEYDHNTLSFKVVKNEPVEKSYVVSTAIDYSGCSCLNNLVFSGIDTRRIEDMSWNITGERNENGRKIITISGNYGSSENYRGDYEEYSYTIDVDAETGIWLNINFNNLTNGTHRTYTSTNYKFGDAAATPITPAEIKEYLNKNGYVNSVPENDISLIG